MTIISVLIIYVEIHKETLWQIEPHTAAKHEILRKYLDAWFPILGTYNKRIVYLDGFSGPGRYIGNEPGSPMVALKSALTHRAKLNVELVFLFIEERKDRAEYLDGEIAKLQCPDHFKISVERGSFADKTGALLDELDGTKSRLAPTFALIDPFGFSGIPYVLMQRWSQWVDATPSNMKLLLGGGVYGSRETDGAFHGAAD